MWSTFLSFVLNVVSHWVALAGVALTVAAFFEGAIEKLLQRKTLAHQTLGQILKFAAKNLTFIALACLLFGCFQAWLDEHNNTDEVINGKDGKKEAWSKFNACDKQLASKSTLSDALSGQVGSQQVQLANQQDTFNRCILALGASSVPQPTRTPLRVVRSDLPLQPLKGGEMLYGWILIATTNKAMSPTNILVSCDSKFTTLVATFAGIEQEIGKSVGQINDHQYRRRMASPAWRSDTPLVMLVAGGKELGNCSLKLD
jgi:hypothetical protein